MKYSIDEQIKNRNELLKYGLGIIGLFVIYLGFMTTDIVKINLLALSIFS